MLAAQPGVGKVIADVDAQPNVCQNLVDLKQAAVGAWHCHRRIGPAGVSLTCRGASMLFWSCTSW